MLLTTRRLAAGLVGTGLATLPVAAEAATVRVEGQTRTLVRPVDVTTSPNRTVGPPGRPTCSGLSALSLLDAATGGAWSGTYFEGLGWSVDRIRGERHGGSPDFFSFWLNHREASTGLCTARPKAGDDVLLFVSRFPEPKGGILPLGLHAPARATAGRSFRVRVVQYAKTGRVSPARRALVTGGGATARTDARGYARLRYRRGRPVTLRATRTGRIRSETETVDVR